MKYKDSNNEWQELVVKAADTLPVGTVVDYDGDEVPAGWEAAGSDDYSTEEQFTGKYWINGKKIYRKVIVLNQPIVVNLGEWNNVTDVSQLNISVITDMTLISEQFVWNGVITRIDNNNLQLMGVGREGTAWYLKTLVLEYIKNN